MSATGLQTVLPIVSSWTPMGVDIKLEAPQPPELGDGEGDIRAGHRNTVKRTCHRRFHEP
jgi:hypothetical protein